MKKILNVITRVISQADDNLSSLCDAPGLVATKTRHILTTARQCEQGIYTARESAWIRVSPYNKVLGDSFDIVGVSMPDPAHCLRNFMHQLLSVIAGGRHMTKSQRVYDRSGRLTHIEKHSARNFAGKRFKATYRRSQHTPQSL